MSCHHTDVHIMQRVTWLFARTGLNQPGQVHAPGSLWLTSGEGCLPTACSSVGFWGDSEVPQLSVVSLDLINSWSILCRNSPPGTLSRFLRYSKVCPAQGIPFRRHCISISSFLYPHMLYQTFPMFFKPLMHLCFLSSAFSFKEKTKDYQIWKTHFLKLIFPTPSAPSSSCLVRCCLSRSSSSFLVHSIPAYEVCLIL